MRRPSLSLSLSLAVLLLADVLAQDPVEIQFQTDPVLIQTGTEVVFTVLTVPQVFSMIWQYQGGVTVGQWSGGNPAVNPGTQFAGRVTIAATQLRIGGAQLRDAGNFTVEVTPAATTGLAPNSRSIQLRVFDAVVGVSLFVPSVAVEGRNVSLRCTWTGGTGVTVQWGKGGVAVTTDGRITVSGGSLVADPARRSDAGEYTCTVSNPVSAQTATRSLTVFYGPDTPVLTHDAPKECVGGGDVLVGQTVRLTCLSDSLPPALFTWQRDGQAVAADQPDSGVLSLQTFSTDESGRYVCTARNAVTGGTSDQGIDLAVVDTCLNVGEVVGIVIGCLLLIIIIVLLIVLIVFLARRRRAEQRRSDNAALVPKTNPNPVPPDPLPNGPRDLGQGPHPPLYHTRTLPPDRLYAAPHGSPQTLPMNGLRSADARQNNTRTNGRLHNGSQNADSHPHDGVDNRAFTHAEAQNAPPPTQQQHNPNIVIQTGAARGGAQTPTVHVSLNALPNAAQQSNNNAQLPTIHVNLNSYPNQQTPDDDAFPVPNTTSHHALQSTTETQRSHPRMQSEHSYHSDPRGHRGQPALVATGHTHYNVSNTPTRNANTQTYRREPERPRRPERDSWDLLRGTPAYPSGTFHTGRRRSPEPEVNSDTTGYTTHPPIREARTPTRSQHRPQSRSTSRSVAPPRQEAASEERRARSADLRDARGVTQLEAERRSQGSGHTQRRSAQRGPPGRQNASRQEATHNNNPRAPPLMSRGALSQGPVTQQGPAAPRAADSRALADPNHLPQAHMAQQHRAAPVQTPPQGPGGQTQPVINAANQARQGGSAPVPVSAAQRHPSNLTQAALSVHTEQAQTFQNRRQQTQAALLHPGPHDPRGPQAPAPPPVIPLAEFQTLPRKHTQHRSPARAPQPPRPPVNMPVAQRHQQVQQRPANHHHHHHHHHPGNGHLQGNSHAHGHRHNPHFTHTQQHPAHRGRPR